jgi:hypothetical protein
VNSELPKNLNKTLFYGIETKHFQKEDVIKAKTISWP